MQNFKFLFAIGLSFFVSFPSLWVSVESNSQPIPVNNIEMRKAENWADAKKLFFNCVPCHGINGDGKGKMLPSITGNPPRNFLDQEIGHVSDLQLARTIREGGAAVGLNPIMPGWGEVLEEEDIQLLVKFIKEISRKGKMP